MNIPLLPFCSQWIGVRIGVAYRLPRRDVLRCHAACGVSGLGNAVLTVSNAPAHALVVAVWVVACFLRDFAATRGRVVLTQFGLDGCAQVVPGRCPLGRIRVQKSTCASSARFPSLIVDMVVTTFTGFSE